MAGGITVSDGIAESARHLAEVVGEELESLLYYEHPFTSCGVLAVASDRLESYPDLLARIYRILREVPKIHCLRRRELFWLALPGYTTPPSVDDQPHLAHCVKYRSQLLHGRDYRPEIPLPAQPQIFLSGHVRSCRHYFRIHCLKRLLAGEHGELLTEIVAEMRRLISTALMADEGWRVDLAEVAERFAFHSGAGEIGGVVLQLEDFATRAPAATSADARAAVFLFERLLKLLAREAA